MKRIIPLCLMSLWLIIAPAALAQGPNPVDVMAQANQLYEAGQFSEAAVAYQSLVDAGFENGTLFFNLGNAYFKQEDWGNAILNYRRAQRITPRDPDIWANLTLARAHTVDQIEAEGQVFFSQLLKVPEQWLTLNELAIVTLALWFVLIGLIILITRLPSEAWKQRFSYLTVVTGVLLGIGILSMASWLYLSNTQPDGVIVALEVDVTSGPGDQYIKEFTVHSGTEIGILEERSNWVRITLPGGQLQGWVPAPSVAVVGG